MQKVIRLFLVMVLLALVVGGSAYLYRLKSEVNVQVIAPPEEELVARAYEIEQAWKTGHWGEKVRDCADLSELMTYLEERELDPTPWLRCEPKALSCFLKTRQQEQEGFFSPSWSESTHVKVFFHESEKVERDSWRVFFKLQNKQKTLIFSLADECSDSLIAPGIKAYGPGPKGGTDWLWDNREGELFLDSYPVSKGEFARWKGQEVDGLEYFEIAGQVSVEDRWAYCEAQGKTPARAHVYDGASFYPPQLSASFIAIWPRGPYPQGRRRAESYLGRYLDQLEPELDIKQLCREIKTAECLERHPRLLARDQTATTVHGVFQVLGGALESMINPLAPNENLKLSSVYFDLNSPHHRLGVRGTWDGESFMSDQFDLVEREQTENLQVGFRCQGRRRW